MAVTADGSTPRYLRGARQEQRQLEEATRLRQRLEESAAHSAAQAQTIASLTDEVQLLRCVPSAAGKPTDCL